MSQSPGKLFGAEIVALIKETISHEMEKLETRIATLEKQNPSKWEATKIYPVGTRVHFANKIWVASAIRHPSASHDDLVQVLKAKGQEMSPSAIRMVRRGFVQTYRALAAAKMLAT
jgi:hypothetical protein